MDYDNIADEESSPVSKAIEYPPSTFWTEIYDEQDELIEPIRPPPPSTDERIHTIQDTTTIIEANTDDLMTDMSTVKGQLASIVKTQDALNKRLERLTSSVNELGTMLATVIDQLKYIRFDTKTTRQHLMPNSGL